MAHCWHSQPLLAFMVGAGPGAKGGGGSLVTPQSASAGLGVHLAVGLRLTATHKTMLVLMLSTAIPPPGPACLATENIYILTRNSPRPAGRQSPAGDRKQIRQQAGDNQPGGAINEL